jgi:VanZ family protein
MVLKLTLVIALAIAALTLTPPGASEPGIAGGDKLVHFLAFAVLAMPMAYARRLPLFLIILAGVAYGGLIELIQPYVGRSGEWGDLLADGLGAFLGAWFAARMGCKWRMT